MDLMEELAFARKRTVKRRIMEAQVQGGGGGGGGEVRRVHIIYFLSRKGRVEHPHLVRVHHLSRNGVRLRDVKRWLSELRGKDMPESFAWSYKRKYKAGYVWQDLLDEDLITPISDNEYVLKGSEIASTTFINEKCSNGEKDASTQKKSQSPQVETKEQKSSSNGKCRKISESPLDHVSTKTSFEIEEESPRFGSETSSLTDDSSKHEKDKVSVTTKREEENGQRDKTKNNSGISIPLTNDKNSEGNNVNNTSTLFKKTSPPTPSSASNSSIGKSSSFSGGASHMFRNWITCGAVDTNDSAVMVINRRSSASSGVFSNKENSKKIYKGDVGKRDKLGGSERILAHSWLLEEQHGGSARHSFDERKGPKKSKADESEEKKAVSAAYKPINRPNCSQCGRQFRPEKLHAHMKSCRGKKAMAKSSGGDAAAAASSRTTDKTPLRRTTDNSFQNSSYYLTDK